MVPRWIFLASVLGASIFPLGLCVEVECPSVAEGSSDDIAPRGLLQSPQMLGTQASKSPKSSSSLFHDDAVSHDGAARHSSVVEEITQIMPFALLTSHSSSILGSRFGVSPGYVTVGMVFSALIVCGLAAKLAYSLFSGSQSTVATTVTVALLYILASSAMIETNKWLMLPGKFPYPIAMATNHMVASFALASCFRFVCPSAFPALQKVEITPKFCLKLVPVGAAFALSVVCSNGAYGYLSVSFLQIVKQSNVVITFTLSLLFGLETLRRCNSTLLAFIFFSTLIAIHGELRFDMVGFLIQVLGCFSESLKAVIQGYLMSGTDKLDSMTMVLFLAPSCLAAIAIPLVIVDGPIINELLVQSKMHWFVIVVNATLAFTLNVLVAQVIKLTSPVGFLLCGTIKNICIVVASSVFMGESLAPIQIVSFACSLIGIAMYSMYKQHLDCFEDDALVTGFSRVVSKLNAPETINKS